MLKIRLFKKCYDYALTYNNLSLAGLQQTEQAENAVNSYLTLYKFIIENGLLNEFNRFVSCQGDITKFEKEVKEDA